MRSELENQSTPELAATLGQAGRLDEEPMAPDTMRQVMAEVMEAMFFTEAELASCEHAWLGTARCAWIRFGGSHFGEMLLGVSAEAADPIGASFLGLDPMELTDAQRGQVIQELSNILCGAILSKLWPESKLLLSSPELSPWREWTNPGTLHDCFVIPEGKLAISIRLTAAADSA
jgi:chemotaxis phosphatase CheX-like protein